MPELIVETGPLAGTSFSFGGRIIIGRGATAEVRLDDVTVSRRHAEIRPVHEGWEIADLGSANGVLLNKTKVAAPALIKDTDFIEIGLNGLRFTSKLSAGVGPLSMASTPTEDVGARLLGDLLARVRLFTQLSELSTRYCERDELVRQALDAVLACFGQVERAAVYWLDPGGQGVHRSDFRAREVRMPKPVGIEPMIHEALHHPKGLLLLGEEERKAWAQRLHAPGLSGSLAAIPMRFNGEQVGVFYLDAIKDPNAIKVTDRELLVAVANVLGQLLAPVHGSPSLCDPVDERQDLVLAKRLQQRFLPECAPSLQGYSVADCMVRAHAVGGDHYFYATLADHRRLFLVANASGRHWPAALCMARFGGWAPAAANGQTQLGELLQSFNQRLCHELEEGMCVALAAVALEPASGQLEVALAGRPAPLWRRRDGSVLEMPIKSGPALGLQAGVAYATQRLTLERGDLILLHTAGLAGARNEDACLWGLGPVHQVLGQAGDAAEAVHAVREAWARFIGGAPIHNDLTLIALQRECEAGAGKSAT